jgi:plastocyanin
MIELERPGGIARRLLLRRTVAGLAGAGIAVAIVARAHAESEAEVIVDNFTFAPTPLRIKAGTNVTWVNHDDIPHSIVCPALSVKSHPMDTNETFSYVFDHAGHFDYVCGLHPHMHGTVVVES